GSEAYFLCGPMSAGGGLLTWLADGVYPEISSGSSFATLEAAAASVSPGGSGLVFLPYLGGERAPIWDPLARGAFVGLTHSHDRRHLTRAVYEGVAFAIRHVLDVCEAAAEIKSNQIRCCGGGSKSTLWNQIKANVLQREVLPTRIAETASLGAAMLAGISAGFFDSVHDASDQMVHFGRPVEPDNKLSSLFDTNYGIYRQLYPALCEIA
ncbi:MAG: FGGY-family carbohydrate kinase, partial [Anaerolineales bacterium]|nr:FGGY-family carbohydrate kinase [Anaerolineales bacterium]